MANSVAVHHEPINATIRYLEKVTFFCECGWSGKASELALFLNFSCCPKCFDFDVRIQNKESDIN